MPRPISAPKRQRRGSKSPVKVPRTVRSARAISVKQFRELSGQEHKVIDSSKNATLGVTSDSSGAEYDPDTLLCLNAVNQGDTLETREGNRAAFDSILVQGAIRFTASTDDATLVAGPFIKIYLVLDKQTNGAQLNSEDVFSNPYANNESAPLALKKLSNTARYQILDSVTLDNFIPTSMVETAGTPYKSNSVPPNRQFMLSWKAKRGNEIVTNYTGSGATISAIVDNSVHVIAFCSNINYTPSLTYNARCRFYG